MGVKQRNNHLHFHKTITVVTKKNNNYITDAALNDEIEIPNFLTSENKIVRNIKHKDYFNTLRASIRYIHTLISA